VLSGLYLPMNLQNETTSRKAHLSSVQKSSLIFDIKMEPKSLKNNNMTLRYGKFNIIPSTSGEKRVIIFWK
jgi:hypothetical protein